MLFLKCAKRVSINPLPVISSICLKQSLLEFKLSVCCFSPHLWSIDGFSVRIWGISFPKFKILHSMLGHCSLLSVPPSGFSTFTPTVHVCFVFLSIPLQRKYQQSAWKLLHIPRLCLPHKKHLNKGEMHKSGLVTSFLPTRRRIKTGAI